jgi:membrane associated rhomboid family serine protease
MSTGRSATPGGGGSLSLGSRFTAATFWLFAVELAVYAILAWTEGGKRLAPYLVLSPERVYAHYEVWRLVSALFVHLDPSELLMNALALWLFFPSLDRRWGSSRFVGFFFATGLVGYAVATLVSWVAHTQALLGGCSPVVLAGLAAFGLSYPRMPVQFFGVLPVRAGQLSLFLCGLTALTTLLGGRTMELVAYAGAVACSWLWVRSGGGLGSLRQRWARWRHRRRFSVVQGSDSPPGGSRKGPPGGSRWVN